MYDFINRIDLQKIKSNDEIKNKNLEEYVNRYLFNLYGRVLKLCYQHNKMFDVTRIQQEYFGANLIVPIVDSSDKINELEKNVLSKLPIEGNCELNRKEDKIAVINFMLQEYKHMLKKELVQCNKEDLFIIFYMISSMLSYISMNSAYLFKYKATDAEKKDINISNLIVDSIGLIYHEAELEIGNMLGAEKKSCEYLVSFILNEYVDDFEHKGNKLNIDNIFLITNKIVETLAIKKSLSNLYHYGTKLNIEENNLRVSDDFNDKLKLYFDNVYTSNIDISSPEVDAILMEFERKEGYSIKILEDYVNKLHDKNLIIECAGNIVENKFLYHDICKSTGASIESTYRVVQAISLRKSEEHMDHNIFSTDNRIFRTPIVKIGNHFLLSHNLLVEAAHYLRYRILKSELSKDAGVKDKIEKLYDEKELNDLLLLIKKYGITGDINFKFEDFSELKTLFKGGGITKEIDFYFIFNKTLYIMEYKNQDIDRNVYDVCKTYSRNEGYLKKHLRMVDIVKKNKSLMEDFLGKKFDNLKSFLVFKYRNSFPDFYKGNDVFCCSYKEFYDRCKELMESHKYNI
ncbi:hypothetical protein [Clostridium sp. DJ247]|uniref:hypothetical protein n=1 Tax=Clostridium sp. DJ247 TaxID=2726188 RepID=UPI0016292AAE|nr:hypothetical protein [Clostridium sp. DJ247]MBC2582290.1 hypothetical protein [Clostridium sp. DJ247]